MQLYIDINGQEAALARMLEEESVFDDDASIKSNYSHFTVRYDPGTRVILSYAKHGKKIGKAT